MKIKVKDEINDIRYKMNYAEFVLFRLALKQLDIDLEEFNYNVWDCQEIKTKKDLEKTIKKMINKLEKVEDSILPF